MSANKTFTHAGVSRLKGELKARYANDALRVKVLAKNDHCDIDIVELKEPLTKEDAIAYLLSIDFDNGNAEIRAALEAENTKRHPEVKEPKVRKTKAVPVVAEAPAVTENEQVAEATM